ncbi:leucine-rich repeat domain-containing protein [Oscillospiraceae bacterium CM]|nr:leucine-rich repeat domain-containing protein [Oscillospiraceae bacterium CM]
MKRILPVVLIVSVILLLVCTFSNAVPNRRDFVIENGVLTKYNGAGGDVVIPGNLGITAIGAKAFLTQSIHGDVANTTITSLAVPTGVTRLNALALSYCTALQTVTMPDTLRTMGDGVFKGCASLTSVTIPRGVSAISNDAFSDCTALRAVTLPDGLTMIGDYAFAYCTSLQTVVLPETLTALGSMAFFDCDALTGVTLPDRLSTIGDAVFAGTAILSPLYSEDGTVLYYVPGSSTDFKIPKSVTELHGGAFFGCTELREITVPNTVKTIGARVFEACAGLKKLTLPKGLTAVSDFLCADCGSLTSVSLPSSVTAIGKAAFSGCASLKTMALPDGLTTIGDSAFWGCTALQSLRLPAHVAAIGDNAFYGAGLKTLTIESKTASFGSVVFSESVGLTLRAPSGSTVEAYAEENGILFQKIP